MRLKHKLLAAAAAVTLGAAGAVAAAQPAFAASCPPGPRTLYVSHDNFYPYATRILENGYLTSSTSTTCTYYGPVYAHALGSKSFVGNRSHTVPR